MPLLHIDGVFPVVDAAPDGDSVRFYPKKPDLLNRIEGKVRLNHAGGVQLRLDGIDALETHFQPQGGGLGNLHQPLRFAHAASAELLKILGFTAITRGPREIVSASTPLETKGFILTRFADTYGRAVAFTFPGAGPGRDGTDQKFDVALLKHSANYRVLDAGLAYPTFYSKLYVDIRDALAASTASARKRKRALWPLDRTNLGVRVSSLATLTDEAVLMPKLFRRLVDYLAHNDGSVSLTGFLKYLEARADRVINLRNGQVTGLDNLITVKGQTMTLTVPPEQIVFIEK